MSAPPRMAGSIVQNTFETLEEMGLLERVKGRLPEDVSIRITGVRSFEWVSIEDHMALYAATLAALGPNKAYEVWRNTLLIGLKKGLFSKVWAMSRAEQGSPMNYYRHLGTVWSTATRGCGFQTIEAMTPLAGEDGRARIDWDELPSVMASSEAFCTAMRAKCEAVLVAAGVQGAVKQAARDPETGSLHLVAHWVTP